MLATRLAQAGELDLVIEITNEAYAPYVPMLGAKPLPMTEDYAPRIASEQVWLVSDSAELLGLLVLETSPGRALIFSLAVRPGRQGRGVGQFMLNLADERARAVGAAQLILYTSSRMERNIRIYRRAGFVETGRRPNPYRPGSVLVDMARPVGGRDD